MNLQYLLFSSLIFLLSACVVLAHQHHYHNHYHDDVDDDDHEHEDGDLSHRHLVLKNEGGGRPCATKELSKQERKKANIRFRKWLKKKRRDDQSRNDFSGMDSGTPAIIDIPTVFHIIANDNGQGSKAIKMVDDQMDVLNKAFSPYGFRFHLVEKPKRIRYNTKWYELRTNKDEKSMKAKLRKGNGEILNVYTGTAHKWLGWATFPSDLLSRAYMDGVVLDWRTMPGGPCYPEAAQKSTPGVDFHGDCDEGEDAKDGCCKYPYNEGLTLVHEVGHWLMLDHVFVGKNCDCIGDSVDDTPTQAAPNRGCPIGQKNTTCEGYSRRETNIHNYMDYTQDSCMDEFTPGQVERMRFAYESYRARIGIDGEDPDDVDNGDIPPKDPCRGEDNPGQNFALKLKTDRYGEESSWDLKDSRGNIVIRSKGFFRSESRYRFGPYCLQPGNYSFTLHDSEADSICCEWGFGSYTMLLEKEEIFTGPKIKTFGSSNSNGSKSSKGSASKAESERKLSLEVELDGRLRGVSNDRSVRRVLKGEHEDSRSKKNRKSKQSSKSPKSGKGKGGSKSSKGEGSELPCYESIEFVVPDNNWSTK